jgi:HTH-type transcriptional regulator/antitoxin HipB
VYAIDYTAVTMQIRTPKEIGLLVRDQRKRLGLTQDGLARRLGTSRLWVVQLEQGKPTLQLGLVLAALNDLAIPLHVRVAETSPRPGGRRRAAIDLDRIIAGTTDRPKA